MVELYNKNMLGVDKMDQLATYYSFLRKSVKRWRKVLFWLLEVSVVNTYIVYTTTLGQFGQQPRSSRLQFRRELILQLFAHRLQLQHQAATGPTSISFLNDSVQFLTSQWNPKGGRRRDCRVCTVGGRRRTPAYFCVICSYRPCLHPGCCFRIYHTRENFWQH